MYVLMCFSFGLIQMTKFCLICFLANLDIKDANEDELEDTQLNAEDTNIVTSKLKSLIDKSVIV